MSKAGPFVIGVDGGTEGLRAGVFDLSGAPIGQCALPYKTDFPKPGWAEQNPADWWNALGHAVRGAVTDADIASDTIAAICLDTTCCSVVALDHEGKPLRPALIWMDVRASREADKVCATGDAALRINNDGAGPVSAEWMIPKALWLKTHQRQLYERAATICEYQDYLNFHLTGRMVASINTAAARWHYQRSHGGYQTGLLDKLGLSDLAEKWPADIVPLGSQIGGLTPRAADHLGLPEGTPVAQGGADAQIGMIGLGVVRPGTMALITGSSHLQLGLSAAPVHGPGIWGTYEDGLIPGLHVVEGGQASTGSVLNWFRNLAGGGDGGDGGNDERNNGAAPSLSYEQMSAEAAAIAPGCDGLTVLDHFQGARTPHTDSTSRGAITGLTLNHSRAHITRAIMESVAFGTALILETMQRGGIAVGEIVIAGGVTRSPLWLQIHADIANTPLTITQVPDAPALGSAILAAVCTGQFATIEQAAEQMVSVTRVIEPDPAADERYGKSYGAYKRAYGALKAIHLED